MNFDSPTQAALSAGMSMDMTGIAGMDVTGGSGGLGLGLGSLGVIGGLGAARTDEEEKRRRVQQVVDVLSQNKGRVSEEGVERFARRVGLECLWEDQMGSAGGLGGRTLIIAGTSLSIDIDFRKDVVGKVALSFPENSEIVTKHAEAAGLLLLQDLNLKEGESKLTKMLDRFSINLERLAGLDKLSVMPKLNCYEAIAGIYESLRRLHNWEVNKLADMPNVAGHSEDDILMVIMRTKSGIPAMNARGQVGLSLQYWQESRRPSASQARASGIVEPKTWSMIIECAPSSSLSYPSIRISDNWISQEIEKQNPDTSDLLSATTGECLDWLEPDNLTLPNQENKAGNSMHSDLGLQKLPDVMFIAKFDPPLVVPYANAMRLHNSIGAPMGDYQIKMLDELLIPSSDASTVEADGAYRRVKTERTIRNKKHRNTLTFLKADYGYTITQLPFSHPRQLLEMLPVLRQYASLASLLDRTFATGLQKEESSNHIKDEFAAFMAQAASGTMDLSTSELPVDVSLSSSPAPRVRMNFPLRGLQIADVCFDVAINGGIKISSQNIMKDGQSIGGSPLTEKDLGRMMEMSEDFGLFAEFVREKFTR